MICLFIDTSSYDVSIAVIRFWSTYTFSKPKTQYNIWTQLIKDEGKIDIWMDKMIKQMKLTAAQPRWQMHLSKCAITLNSATASPKEICKT